MALINDNCTRIKKITKYHILNDKLASKSYQNSLELAN